MSVLIHHLETLTPSRCYPQEYAGGKMAEWTSDERQKRMVRALNRKSGIEQRYSVIESFDEGREDDFFPLDGEGGRKQPSTAQRNAIYTEASRRLAVELARRTIDNCPGIETGDISHVVTISCTGFCNPGPDYHIITELGLAPSTQRYHLGFMGCYAAFPGLHMAQQFCTADPEAVVLVMCLELCTLHLQLDGGEDSMLANALFSDGVAASIVSARPLATGQRGYRLGSFRSTLIPGGLQDMAWTIGDFGFDIALSSYIPKIIGANIEQALAPLLNDAALGFDAIGTWAVHPGGKAIVDKVAESLSLLPEQVAPSREVLRRFGNMSSATILFVLQEALKRSPADSPEQVCAMAFGPGLTVEMALLETQRG